MTEPLVPPAHADGDAGAFLNAAWVQAWQAIGARTDGHDVRAALLARHAEAHRHYHTTQHLQECLRALHAVHALAGQPHVLGIALWFHDAVYDPTRADNEALSAAWAEQALLDARVEATVAARVRDLVLLTRHDAVPEAGDAQLLVDIDLGILGAPQPRFEAYEHQVRQEYAHVPLPAFRAGRTRVLQGFLDRPRIYGSAHFNALLEARARDNLAWSLAQLDAADDRA